MPRIRAHDCDVQVWKSGARHGQLWRAANLREERLDLSGLRGKDRGQRRVELLDAMELHKSQGGAVYLLTLTTPISAATFWPSCWTNKERPCNPSSVTTQGQGGFQEMGHVGQVRALEVTHGRKAARNNGWHPLPYPPVLLPKR